MKKYIVPLFTVFTICFSVFSLSTVFGQAGNLDPTFGNNGIVIYNYGSQYHDNTFGVHVYEDTSILVCGIHMDFSYNTTGNLQKFLPDGSIDMTWGTDGMITFQYGIDTYPYSMIVLPDGKILISGTTYLTAPDAEFFAARFNADGTPDLTFNSSGEWHSAYAADEELCNDMAIQPDGKIVLVGRTGTTVFNALLFARLNNDGTLDTGFGTNGFTEINSATQNENVNGVGILSDGTIVGVGYTHLGTPWYGEFSIMVKLDTNGDPYPGFGTDGVLIPSVFTDYSNALNCVIVNDSIIITGGFGDPNVDQSLFITRLDQDGNPDPDFGNNGINVLDIDPLTRGEDLYFAEDNKFYICGTSGQNGLSAPRDFFLARYNYNGSINEAFNGSGYVKTSVGSAWDHAYGLDIGPDGKIVLAGFTAFGPTGDNDRALVRYLNDYLPPPPLIADFTADETTVCEGDMLSFTDLSIGNIISWNWSFTGGDPETSTLENPEIMYNSPGVFDVQLEISDGTQTATVLKENYISVGAYPEPAIIGSQTVCSGYEATYQTDDNPGNNYMWEVTGGEISAGSGTNQVLVLWGDPGTGSITLTEVTQEECSTTTLPFDVVIDDCTGIDEFENGSIHVYPNPTVEYIDIKSTNNILNIKIIDFKGMIVRRQEGKGNKNCKVDMSNLPAGLYNVDIETNAGWINHKVIKK